MSHPASLQSVIELVEALPPDDQDLLIELIQKRRIDQRREEIAKHGQATLAAWQAGSAKRGTLADLKADLLSDSE